MSVLIAGYARTPFARYAGALAAVSASELGGHAAAAAIARAGITPDLVDAVYAGQVLQAAAGQNPARQSAVAADIPLTTPAMTFNAVCLSGTLAIREGVRLIEGGEASVVVAIGQESMSQAPHALSALRAGKRYGAATVVDTLELDGLTDAFERRSMGSSTQVFADEAGIGRGEQDEWAARSHQRLAASQASLVEEIAPIEIPDHRGSVRISGDDGLRADTTTNSLARIRPAFSATGSITAGNSSQITDGAAAIVLVHEDFPMTTAPLARIRSHSFVAGPGVSLLAQPAVAIRRALERIDATPADLTSAEINEAFAAVAVHSVRQLGIDAGLVNPEGGAIAIGHPVGASGARIVGTLARRLHAIGPGLLGAAGICGGGGQGAAIIVESV
ncbi:MAG TPA: acetyl-CoA C-acyltransferase [Microbacterium sp.]|nr:acetyl-CoA C-acyltransferase [Microbacterium sp.]|tara:strand:+ start:1726 stop:2892 length:1167 start_codon:yes stop_codon:yes gene_type:complete